MEVQYISLNMTPMGVNPCFHISQYDVGRILGFIVHSGGATVDLDTYTCTIEATRSDGTAITSAVVTTDNMATFEVTPTMSNKADKYRCQLVIVDENSKRIASLPFDMDVTKAAMDENSESIEEDASLYQQYTKAVQGAIAEANADIQAEENARIAADSAEATARANADTTLQNNIDAEATARADAITAEATARQTADNTLQGNIDSEASARQTADNTLQSNINTEASTRASADSNLQSQINQIVAPSGEAPSAAEVQNARIGSDGVTYPTLGDAIRTQNSNLKSQLNQVIEPFKVTNSGTGGVNVAYPMSIGDSILVTNKTSASIEVRQRNGSATVIATTVVMSGTTRKITSTVDSVDIRFYFNQGGTILFENADKRLPIVEEKVEDIDEQKGVQSFLINQLLDSKLIFHRADYHSDELNTDVVIAEYDVEYPYTALYVKADAMDDVSNNYPIGIKEYDASNTLLGATGRSKSRCLQGASLPLNYLPNTKKVKVYINVGETATNSIKNVFIWSTRFGRVENKPYPVFRVEKDGSGDFTSLVDAITEANRYMDAKVYLGAGTWDIIEELGSDYLTNVSGVQRGLYLKNRVHLICDSRSKIVANYNGDLDNVKTWLAIFNSGEYGFTLENATLEGSNIRYLIHDERDQDTDAYTNKYINCTMVFDNRNNTAWSAKQCIGGGLGQNGYIDIEGCTFKSYQGYDGTVSYHNTGASTGRSHIVMRDCYFYLYNTFRLSWYGTSEAVTEALVTGCYLGANIVHRAENSSATVENTSIVEWNNTINPHS